MVRQMEKSATWPLTGHIAHRGEDQQHATLAVIVGQQRYMMTVAFLQLPDLAPEVP